MPESTGAAASVSLIAVPLPVATMSVSAGAHAPETHTPTPALPCTVTPVTVGALPVMRTPSVFVLTTESRSVPAEPFLYSTPRTPRSMTESRITGRAVAPST